MEDPQTILDAHRSQPDSTSQAELEKQRLLGENQRQKALLEAIFEADPSGVAVLVGPELRFAFTNPAYRYTCPDPVVDPVGKPYDEVWPVRSKYGNRNHFLTVLATGRPYQVSGVEHCFADHTERIFTVQARRIEWDDQLAVLVLMWDITEQYKAQRLAERERSHLQAVLEALPVGVAILDDKGGHIQSNATFNQIWQGPLPPTHDVSDYAAYQAWWADTGEPVQPQEWASAQAVQNGVAVLGQEMKIRRFDGSEAFVRNSGVPIRDARGRVTGSVVAIEDITRRHEAETALVVSNERLAALTEAATSLLAGSDPIARLNEFFDNFSSRLGLEIYVQYNLAPDGTHLDLVSWAGIPEKYNRLLKRLELGQAVCGTVAQIRQPIIVTDVQHSTDRKTELIRKLGVGTYACHPLMVGERLLGTLSFGSRRLSRFEPETINLLRTFCNLVALAIDRQRTEQALRDALDAAAQAQWAAEQSEERLRLLTDRLPDSAVYQYTHEADGSVRFHYFSAGIEALNGVRPEDVLRDAGTLHRQFSPQDFQRLLQAEERSAKDLTDFEMEAPMRRPDGQVRWMRLSSRPRRLPDGNTIWDGVQVDITEQRLIHQALEEGEARFHSLFEGMAEGFALHEIACDEHGVPCDYRFLEINPAFERLTGLKREAVVGKWKSEIAELAGDDPYWIEIYGKVALTGESVHFEKYSPALKQHFEVFSYRPAPNQFAVLFIDMTERKLAEEKLAFQAGLLDKVQNAVVAADEHWQVTYWNPAAVEMFGLTEAEAMGRNVRQIFQTDFLTMTPDQAVQELIENGIFTMMSATGGKMGRPLPPTPTRPFYGMRWAR
jgi:PAS domain S-box-containing protein